MAQEFRYSLTRICLRTGQLSLSRRMAEIFPESGSLTALDTVDDREIALTTVGPRRVAGMEEYFRRHKLQVNDAVSLRPLPDGRVALTALRRSSRRDYREPGVVAELLNSLLGEKPRSEAEIRALHPDLPEGFPLAQALREDGRFRSQAGRWEATAGASVEPAADRQAAEAAVDEPKQRPEPETGTPAVSDDATNADTETIATSADDPEEAMPGHEAAADVDHASSAVERHEPAADDAHSSSAGEDQASSAEQRPGPRSENRERRIRNSRDRVTDDDRRDAHNGRRSAPQGEGGTVRHAAVTPYPRGVMFPGEAALNSKGPGVDLKAVNRAREALSDFGYKVEGLPHGMLLARAELGRRKHTILIRVLADGERLDWAALLARRREQAADHLAVFGDHRDLHRLTAPAELARATLWSWDGIARVQNLAENILIGPFDVEPHFEKGGMFGPGLQRFESTVSGMIAERGVLSAVLSRLAALRAPSVFVLEDLVESGVSRGEVAGVLEQLSQAPFHLIAKVDKGEYCLRHPVSDGLLQLSQYALSLRERLPRDRRERLAGGSQPDSESGPALSTGNDSSAGSEHSEVPEDVTA